ncbi:DUF2759 family protein [Paenibacillus glacialis]|uniref:DUF2759 domain-containing protein n=1 Tax=Paenibacillus glacialis TaxID=494026 RepID=A0A168L7J6_9BACL|nr:hypothetical protein [Paenibacillus glacialis]OAB42985.1 hypothetical protein PGLA_11055 [Paenibacillus glacialis]
MLLAEGAEAVSKFHTFDIFMILFTILILIGVVRLITQPVKNLFAIGFGVVSLLVFLYSDYAMVLGWIG